ncbi:ABC transporter [Bifidobacterium animalis subsp. animalis]|nr:ABC transporter [Bifidobacterium animalis subsp. animalis]
MKYFIRRLPMRRASPFELACLYLYFACFFFAGFLLHLQRLAEPSSALDDENKERMLMLLRDLNENHGTTVITVTHDSYVANQHSRIITLHQEA